MSNELKLRVGDVVRLKPLTVGFADSGEVTFKEQDREGYFSADLIEEIISRAETDAEKIARLEAELAKTRQAFQTLMVEASETPRKIEWGGGECPVDRRVQVTVWWRNGKVLSDAAGGFSGWTHNRRGAEGADIIAYMVLP